MHHRGNWAGAAATRPSPKTGGVTRSACIGRRTPTAARHHFFMLRFDQVRQRFECLRVSWVRQAEITCPRHEHFVTRGTRVSRASAARRVCRRRLREYPAAPSFRFTGRKFRAKLAPMARGAGVPTGAERPEIQNDKRGNHMDTSTPDLGQHRPESFERIGILFPTDDVPAAPLRAGYGRCSVNGCPCPGFAGNQQLCENCGHNYSMHW